MPFTYEYPRPSLTVDCVIFGYEPNVDITNVASIRRSLEGIDGQLNVLLIKRADDPFKGQWAIPGGFVNVSDDGDQGEDIETAARRELEEETGLKFAYLEQLYTFGTPGRDPRGRVVSVAHFALVRQQDYQATPGSDAAEAHWFAVADALDHGKLAFDHREVLKMAVQRLKGKVRYAPIGFNLLPTKFTLPELQALYETILMMTLDKGNFRRNICKPLQQNGVLVASDDRKKTKRPGPAAQLYRFDKRAYDKAVKDGFNFEI